MNKVIDEWMWLDNECGLLYVDVLNWSSNTPYSDESDDSPNTRFEHRTRDLRHDRRSL